MASRRGEAAPPSDWTRSLCSLQRTIRHISSGRSRLVELLRDAQDALPNYRRFKSLEAIGCWRAGRPTALDEGPSKTANLIRR
jgi:hypothetical protein